MRSDTRITGASASATGGEPNRLMRTRYLFAKPWRRLWNRNPPPLSLLVLAAPTILVMAIPLLYILGNAWSADTEQWARLLHRRIPIMFWRTMSLAAVVTLAAVAVGAILAFLVERTDLPGRRLWRWLLALPLVIPPYVGALTFIIVFGPRGWIANLLGRPLFPVYESLFGTSLVLTLFCCPYAYLITMSNLRRMGGHLEEAAVSCGIPRRRTIWAVTLPALRPALGAAMLLVALYVVSDFGAVAMLRYNTFVSAIYYQITGRFDRSAAAVMATTLIAITVILIWLEAHTRRRLNFAGTQTAPRPPRPFHLEGVARWTALAAVVSFFALSVALPVGVMGYWSVEGIRQGVIDARFADYAMNSLVIAGLAALVCMAATLPLVYLRSRHPGALTRLFDHSAMINYAMPGVIVALGLIFVFSRYFPGLHSTPWLAVTACFIRFFPQSLQSGSASLAHVPTRLDEAGRSLGLSPLRVLWQVTLPLIMPGTLAGGALVFVSTLKELPATLLLRPPGFDTLAVRVWSEAHEGFYGRAAPAALLILAVSILPLKFLLGED